MISGGKRWPLKAPECLAFVMSVGTISERDPQVDDAVGGIELGPPRSDRIWIVTAEYARQPINIVRANSFVIILKPMLNCPQLNARFAGLEMRDRVGQKLRGPGADRQSGLVRRQTSADRHQILEELLDVAAVFRRRNKIFPALYQWLPRFRFVPFRPVSFRFVRLSTSRATQL